MQEVFYHCHVIHRSSRPKVFSEKFGLQLTCNFIKQQALGQMFSGEFCEIFKNIYFYRTLLVAVSGYKECDVNKGN